MIWARPHIGAIFGCNLALVLCCLSEISFGELGTISCLWPWISLRSKVIRSVLRVNYLKIENEIKIILQQGNWHIQIKHI